MEEEISDYTEIQQLEQTLDLNAVLDASANIGSPPWYESFWSWIVISALVVIIPLITYLLVRLINGRK